MVDSSPPPRRTLKLAPKPPRPARTEKGARPGFKAKGQPASATNPRKTGSGKPRQPAVAQPLYRPATAAQSPSARAPAGSRAADRPASLSANGIRLNKYLADAGWCSRREADHWIERGWVHVNGQPAGMGLRVLPGDRIEVAPAARARQEQQASILLHKPVGYVSAQAEDGHVPAVTLLTEANRWHQDPLLRERPAPRSLRGFAPAGRLDIDSTGLLILTQDGRLARHVIGQDSSVEKEYLVRVSYRNSAAQTISENVQAVFPAASLARLRHGLQLDGVMLKPAQVDWLNPEQLRFILQEGRKRQIRRMCEQVGLHVTGLKRVRIGNIALGQLPAGQWRYLTPDEHI